MKITAEDLYALGAVDAVIPEGEELSQETLQGPASEIGGRLEAFLRRTGDMSKEEIVEERFERFRRL